LMIGYSGKIGIYLCCNIASEFKVDALVVTVHLSYS
jgi:hypothetical protein